MRRLPSKTVAILGVCLAIAAVAVGGATASTKPQGERAGLRAAAGHEVVGPLGAVRRARLHEGRFAKAGVTASINNALNDPLEAEGTGAGVPRSRREGRHRDGARQRLRRSDREAVHLEGRQGDRLRPPGHRRLGLGLRHLRRQGRRRGAGQRRHRRDEGERHLQGRHGRRAVGRPDRPERVLVQERQRRRLQPALHERRDQEGPAAVRPRLGCEQRGDHLPPDARQDEQQHPGRASRRTTTSPAQ